MVHGGIVGRTTALVGVVRRPPILEQLGSWKGRVRVAPKLDMASTFAPLRFGHVVARGAYSVGRTPPTRGINDDRARR